MHNLCFLLFFSKITFYWKLFSDCCDQFGYPGSIVYLSCFISFIHDLHLCNNFGASNINIEDFKGKIVKNHQKLPLHRYLLCNSNFFHFSSISGGSGCGTTSLQMSLTINGVGGKMSYILFTSFLHIF